MLSFWKINSETLPTWTEEDERDPHTFIVIVFCSKHELDYSSCILSNSKSVKKIRNKFMTLGHSTLHIIAQYDVFIETGVKSIKVDMPVKGINAFHAYLASQYHRPFSSWNLNAILESQTPNLEPPDDDENTIYTL